MRNTALALLFTLFFGACSPAKKIATSAKKNVLTEKALAKAHVGISIYEPATRKYWYNHQADKYFVPASNVKIATCYAALKYLGDSLRGLKYEIHENNTLIAEATGDPTFLHPGFKNQPVFDLLKQQKHILINTENWKEKGLGKGWLWDDYNDDYMAERSPMPVYGNVVRFGKNENTNNDAAQNVVSFPTLFQDSIFMDDEENNQTGLFTLERKWEQNTFWKKPSQKSFFGQEIPLVTNGFETTKKLLKDTLKSDIRTSFYTLQQPEIVYSQPTDSVLKPMMHRSDNFFAEQLLLMVSNKLLGVMKDEKIIDTLLQSDFKNLPQIPRWVDGSGLSRYNLFTPRDFVYLLHKMQTEFGFNRLKEIFPTGNEGSLTNYFQADSSYIFAKTGSMSGVVSLSGYLYTRKNKLLVFSVLVNNHNTSATEVKRAVEKFLEGIRNRY